MLAFQRDWPHLNWSSKTPDIGKLLRRGQAITHADSFNKLLKREI